MPSWVSSSVLMAVTTIYFVLSVWFYADAQRPEPTLLAGRFKLRAVLHFVTAAAFVVPVWAGFTTFGWSVKGSLAGIAVGMVLGGLFIWVAYRRQRAALQAS